MLQAPNEPSELKSSITWLAGLGDWLFCVGGVSLWDAALELSVAVDRCVFLERWLFVELYVRPAFNC